MTDERWHDVLDHIKETFTVFEHDTEEYTPEDGGGTVEFLVFESPMGKIRLERDVHAKVVGTKVTTSRRIGSGAREEKIYSTDEMVDTLHVYRWDATENDWVPFEEFSSRLLGG